MGATNERNALSIDVNVPVTFERPPVIETVLGVQFKPLPKLKDAHLGAYWKELGSDWPNVTDSVPIEQQFERFTADDSWGGFALQVQLTQDPSARLMIKNRSSERMIQVQNGRFHYNWVRSGSQPYPRYNVVRPEFDEKISKFRAFLLREGLGELVINQWEVTYVNQISKGELWSTPADWPNVIKSLSMPTIDVAQVHLESLAGEWHFEIPPAAGRLHMHLKHGRSGGETKSAAEQLFLTLTARGPIPETGFSAGLDLGRQTIVNAFKAFTTERAHKHWGIK